MIREFYVKGKWLGCHEDVRRAYGESEAISSLSLSSFVFVSPSDGLIWGRSPLIKPGHHIMPFFVFTKPGVGEGHRTDYGPSGSFLAAGSWIIDQLPRQVLRYELLIHCDWAMSRPTNLEEFLSCLNSTPSSQTVTDLTVTS